MFDINALSKADSDTLASVAHDNQNSGVCVGENG